LGVLLGTSRKKVAAFPSHLLSARPGLSRDPFTLSRSAAQVEGKSLITQPASPILVSALPIVSQQTSVLAALLNNLLLHHAGVDEETLYAYGEVELLTFLSAVRGVDDEAIRAYREARNPNIVFTADEQLTVQMGQMGGAPGLRSLSRLLASTDPRLSFMSHANRRHSALFFKLFNVELLRVDGFSRHCFVPPISIAKPIPHERKLKELNVVNGLLYAVGIRPARVIALDSTVVGAPNPEGEELDSRCLLSFAHWMHLVGKQPASKDTAAVLEELCPESFQPILLALDGDRPIGELSTSELEKAFLVVRDELQHRGSFEVYKEAITAKRNA
uniref:DUF362 domain-containing protein n=1 Tax=Heligmosomoides polygyrus TaxID=6339 RepID=A0A8L8KPZ4_HELPZ